MGLNSARSRGRLPSAPEKPEDRGLGNAFAIYGGETTGAIIAVQRDHNFGMTLVAQMQRQAGLQLTGDLFGGKLLGGQCLQRLLQIIDFDFSSW